MGRCSSVGAALKRNFIAYPRGLWASHHCLEGPAMTMGDDRPSYRIEPNQTKPIQGDSRNTNVTKKKNKTENRQRAPDKRYKTQGQQGIV